MKKMFYSILLVISIILPNKIEAYTRSDLEDIIVSTGLSYYYNNKYTDYEGAYHDEVGSMYTNNYNVPPEMLGRSNYMITQCDAFVSSIYINSLGYDFSEYYNKLIDGKYTRYNVYNSNVYTYGTAGESEFKNLYKYFNKAFSVKFMNRIAEDTSSAITVYYNYNANGFDNLPDSELNYIKGLLLPGDIILNDGHAMLWVGNALESNGGGAIHSSGVTYDYEKKYTGYDDFSVRYSDADYIFNNQVKKHGNDKNTIIAILRPINAFCGEESNICDTSSTTLNSNNNARRELKRLRIEQYLYDTNNDRTLNYNNSSIGEGDTISYRLYLANKSEFDICSNGKTTDKDKCTDTWKTISNDKDYTKITIKATIPEGTTYVDCSNNCTVDGKTITWNNVSINKGKSNTYHYTVRVNEKSQIIKNPGMTLTYNNKTLQLANIETKVNSTITGKYSDILKKQVEDNISKTCTNSINFITNLYSDYLKNSNITKEGNVNLSNLLTYDNIVNSAFSGYNLFGSYFRRKISSEESKLTGNESIINSMLVEKIYGGNKYQHVLYSTNEMNRLNKIVPIWSTLGSLNVGDIIITINDKKIDAMLYTGIIGDYQTLIYCDNGKVTQLGKATNVKYRGEEINSLYSNRLFLDKLHNSDLYVVLRPSKYYKPKLNYTLNYLSNGGNDWTKETCSNGFTFNSTDKTCKKTTKYKGAYGEFPTPTKKGYTFDSWAVYLYNSSTKKYDIKTIINKKDIFSVGYNQTVYAQWKANVYSIMLDTKDKIIYQKYNNEWCSDKECKTKITNVSIPKKTGYTFKGYYTSPDGKGTQVIDQTGKILENTNKTFCYDNITTIGTLYSYFVKNQETNIPLDTNQIIKDTYSSVLEKINIENDENGISNGYIIITKPYSSKKIISNINKNYKMEIDNKSDYIYSGAKTIIYQDNKKIKEYINILIGDINGDGKITSADYIKVKKHIMKTEILSKKVHTLSADVNRDNNITSADYVKIKKYIINGEV